MHRRRRRRRHCCQRERKASSPLLSYDASALVWQKCLEGKSTKEAFALECESAEGANDGSGRCAF